MVLSKIYVARIKTGTHMDIIEAYKKEYKKYVGEVVWFPNPHYQVNGKIKFVLPWYLFVVPGVYLDIKKWTELDSNIYYFLTDKSGTPRSVDYEEFVNFMEYCKDFIKVKSAISLKDYIGRKVKITSGLFAHMEGVVTEAKKEELGIRLLSDIPILIWVKSHEVEILPS